MKIHTSASVKTPYGFEKVIWTPKCKNKVLGDMASVFEAEWFPRFSSVWKLDAIIASNRDLQSVAWRCLRYCGLDSGDAFAPKINSQRHWLT